MDIVTPHQIIFETDEAVPIAEVVSSLLGADQLFRDMAPLLEGVLPGLKIDKINVSVRSISQESPLREIILLGLIAQYQKDMERDVPVIIQHLTGMSVPAEYNALISLVLMVLVFYGIDFLFKQVHQGAFSKHIRSQFEELTKELSKTTGISEEKIGGILEGKYGKSRVRVIASSALRLFSPSKRNNNSPVVIDGRRIERDTIAEIPSDAQIDAANVPEIVKPHENVHIELHAQDMDRSKQGWAAVVPEIWNKRLRMEIYPPIKPEDIYTKKRLRGDIMLVSQKQPDGSYRPSMFHLMNIITSE
jgi:hypothetical protein